MFAHPKHDVVAVRNGNRMVVMMVLERLQEHKRVRMQEMSEHPQMAGVWRVALGMAAKDKPADLVIGGCVGEKAGGRGTNMKVDPSMLHRCALCMQRSRGTPTVTAAVKDKGKRKR